MSGPLSSYGVGRYQATRGDVLWTPPGYVPGSGIRGVVYCHGAGELASVPLNYAGGKQNEARILAAIASVYPVVMADLGVFGQGGASDSNGWGNANAQAELTAAIAWLQNAAGGGAAPGSVLLAGFSMGHALQLLYAQANPAKVAAILGILPVNDLDDIRDNNRGTYQQSISTAWNAGGGQVQRAACGTTSGSPTVTDANCVAGDNGKYVSGPGIPYPAFVGTVTAGVSYLLSSSATGQVNINATATGSVTLNLTPRWTAPGTPALPAGANPALPVNQGNVKNIPQLVFYATDDPICTPATALTLLANLGPACQGVPVGPGGHSDASIGQANVQQILAFLAANAGRG